MAHLTRANQKLEGFLPGEKLGNFASFASWFAHL